ncbi:MAG: DNA gyrase inhibitor YacG [Burkholderiaceae bacterium]
MKASQPVVSKPAQRIVKCPSCGGPSVYAPENLFRPFCSERCKGIDLGAWAAEEFRVNAKPEPGEDFPPEPPSRH